MTMMNTNTSMMTAAVMNMTIIMTMIANAVKTSRSVVFHADNLLAAEWAIPVPWEGLLSRLSAAS